MATPTPMTFSVSEPPIVGGRYLGISPQIVVPDGIYTWCDTTVTAIYRNGATYIGWVDSEGYSGVSKFTHATQTAEHTRLSSVGLKEIDDHDMASLHFRPDGRLVAFFGPHNTPDFIYRVALDVESVTNWGPICTRGGGDGSYSYPFLTRFSQVPNRYFFFSRRYAVPSGVTRVCSYRTTDSLLGNVDGAPNDPWSTYNDIWRSENFIPYWQYALDGVNTMHIFATDKHPVEGQSSLYHFYLQLDGSDTPRLYDSFGSEIVTQPATPASATLVYDGTSVKCWVSDAAIRNGSPVCLWMRYPNNNGTQIEYWYARWSGSAWQNYKITDDGAGLYPQEQYYHGGLSFDANDPDIIYLSAPYEGQRQIQEWRTADAGETWTRERFITSGSHTGIRARPYSPRNHNNELKVLWWQGRYDSYGDYNTSIYGGQ